MTVISLNWSDTSKQIILCMVSQNIFWNISELTRWSSCQCEGEVMMDMWSIKEMIQCATFGIPKGMKKCNFYFYCFLLWLFGRVVINRIFIDKGLTMTPFLATQLWRLVTYFTCLLFQTFFLVLLSSEVIFYFWSKSEGKKAKEIEIAFLYSLGNPKGCTSDHFFHASYICHNFPCKPIPISIIIS